MDDARFSDVAGPLRLLARDAEDLIVVSAMVQDAILPIGEMTYLEADRQFVLLLNRFQWERVPATAAASARTVARHGSGVDAMDAARPGDADPVAPPPADATVSFGDGGPVYLRTHCGVRVSGVERVRTQGIDPSDRGRLLNLLGLEWREGGLDFLFSDGATVRLIGTALEVRVEDIGQPWPTALRPDHPDIADDTGNGS